MQVSKENQLKIYVTKNGKKPFVNWLESLKNKVDRYRIKERLDRVVLGNLGDHKPVGEGIYELRLQFSSGYRVYFGRDGDKVILLLSGGDKSTQRKDIKKASDYWQDYLAR